MAILLVSSLLGKLVTVTVLHRFTPSPRAPDQRTCKFICVDHLEYIHPSIDLRIQRIDPSPLQNELCFLGLGTSTEADVGPDTGHG